ncbi:hypothetical protein diail_6466 [Diaporthe ilicicola]|nr:hypothetical protein diail_6466 [Diaporthe ilicicola]
MVRLHALHRSVLRPGLSPQDFGLRGSSLRRCSRHRGFVTLGIETSCDDTCVSILRPSKRGGISCKPWRVSCGNKQHQGVHPVEAVKSHTRNLPALVQKALRNIPTRPDGKRTPDLIAVTRGPGMTPCLSVGISFAKALSVALDAPLVGVHHMQAHALAVHLDANLPDSKVLGPQFPFLTLLYGFLSLVNVLTVVCLLLHLAHIPLY